MHVPGPGLMAEDLPCQYDPLRETCPAAKQLSIRTTLEGGICVAFKLRRSRSTGATTYSEASGGRTRNLRT